MQTIELNDYYPNHVKGSTFSVSDEVASVLRDFARQETARQVKIYRYRAYYSLDNEDGIERRALRQPETPEEIVERNQINAQLYEAMHRLPTRQARRCYTCFILGKSMAEIARVEGVSKQSVSESIGKALCTLKKSLEESQPSTLTFAPKMYGYMRR